MIGRRDFLKYTAVSGLFLNYNEAFAGLEAILPSNPMPSAGTFIQENARLALDIANKITNPVRKATIMTQAARVLDNAAITKNTLTSIQNTIDITDSEQSEQYGAVFGKDQFLEPAAAFLAGIGDYDKAIEIAHSIDDKYGKTASLLLISFRCYEAGSKAQAMDILHKYLSASLSRCLESDIEIEYCEPEYFYLEALNVDCRINWGTELDYRLSKRISWAEEANRSHAGGKDYSWLWLCLIALTHFQLRNEKEAMRCLKKIWKIIPDRAMWIAVKKLSTPGLEQFIQVINCTEKPSEKAFLLSRLGNRYIKEDRFVEALPVLDAAQTIYLNMNRLYIEDVFTTAELSCKKGLVLNKLGRPEDSKKELYSSFATTELLHNKWKDSGSPILFVDVPWLLDNIACEFAEIGEHETVMKILGIQCEDKAYMCHHVAVKLYKKGHKDIANRIFEDLMQSALSNEDPLEKTGKLNSLAISFAKIGQKEKLKIAMGEIIDAYKLHPHEDIKMTLAYLHYQLYTMGFYDEAKQIDNDIAGINTIDDMNNYIAYRNIENREFAKAYELILKLAKVSDRDSTLEDLAEKILYSREPVFLS